jgi:aconitate decarboxylase
MTLAQSAMKLSAAKCGKRGKPHTAIAECIECRPDSNSNRIVLPGYRRPNPPRARPKSPAQHWDNPMTAAARFAMHTIGTSFADLPGETVERAKVFILDSLGVGIAGSSAPHGDALCAIAARWGDRCDVPVWGRSARLPATGAAFVNAWQMHNQEFDCLHEGAVVHAMASVLPAALAVAATRPSISGRDLIVAVAVGCDVAATLGLAARAGMRFFRPATAGGFGAVAAAGCLLGLDEPALQRAFAFQLAQAGGTMQAHLEGSAILPMQVGLNARAALTACELATLDLTPPREVFEGKFGYLELFEAAWEIAPVLDQLGRRWRISEFSHKPYPAGRATHGGIEGVAVLRAQANFQPADVRQVCISAPPLIVRLVGRPDMASPEPTYARLCMAFVVAKVLQHGGLDPAQFHGTALTDPATHALAALVRTESDGNPDPNALAPQRVTVRLADGRTHTWRCDAMLASPSRPLVRAAHLDKFRRCWQLAADPLPPDNRERLIALIDRLETVTDLRDLTRNLAP